jgi:HlyD family secretion protein
MEAIPNMTFSSGQVGSTDLTQAVGTVEAPQKSDLLISKRNRSRSTNSSESSGKNMPSGHGPARKRLLAFLFLLIVGGAAYWTWRYIAAEAEKGKLRVSGRIEGYETNIGAKIGGRVDFIAVREGDFVKIGQLIVRLSDDDIQAQLRGAKARMKKAIDSRDQAVEQISVIKSAVSQSQLNKQQAVEDAEGRIVQADAQVSASRANLSQTEAQLTEAIADLKLAQLRKERYDTLATQGAVMQDQADQADTTLQTTTATVSSRRSAVEAAKKQLLATQGTLTQAKTSRLNPPIRAEALFTSQRQLIQAQSQLKSAQEEIQNAKSSVDEITANIAYLNILSPIDAVVTARAVEPGAVVVAGQTVLSIINLDTVYLRAYVPEGDIGKVRVGQKAFVYLDSAPKKGLESTVIEIDPEASFTPENIYFKDDRVKQVFGMKIAIKDPQRFPKPGMPADADIVLELAQ